MEENRKRICTMCGKEYTYCPHCTKDKDKPTWMFAFCSEDCKDVYQILVDEQYKHITTEDAKEKLSKIDTKDMTMSPESREVLNRILSYSTVSAQPVETGETQEKPTSFFGKLNK